MLRGEQATVSGVVGIVVLLIGAFALGAKSLRDFFNFGGHRVIHDKAVRLVIVAAAIYAISSVYDKSATLHSDPMSYVWYSTIWRAVPLIALFAVLKRPTGLRAWTGVLSTHQAMALVSQR